MICCSILTSVLVARHPSHLAIQILPPQLDLVVLSDLVLCRCGKGKQLYTDFLEQKSASTLSSPKYHLSVFSFLLEFVTICIG